MRRGEQHELAYCIVTDLRRGRIVAFGTETKTVALPRPLGYRVHTGDSVLVSAALFNPTAKRLDSLFVRVRIAYTTMDSRARHTAVLPLYLDVHDEPGARTFIEPCDSGPRLKWWRLTVPAKPRPFERPITSTISASAN